MTRAEVVELAKHGMVTIGAHTEHHLWLPSQSSEERRRELVVNKAKLEQLLQRSVTALAYPYGAVDDATIDAQGLQASARP